MSMSNVLHGTGVVTGTGVDLNVDKVGFKPTAVHVFNTTDGSHGHWVVPMADDSAMKHKAGTVTTVTTNGITPRANGFQLGADADLNASGDSIYYECWG